jgi:hypothetical protein
LSTYVERRIAMEVKIGIQMAPRELVVETESAVEDVKQALAAALADHKLFVITDKRGGTVLVPAEKIAYVELDQAEPRRIGFSSN